MFPENSSREFTRDRVFQMIREQTDKWNWQFVYLGANQDAMRVADQIGVSTSAAMAYDATAQGTDANYSSLAHNISDVRTGGRSDLTWSDEQRRRARGSK